MVEWPAFFFYQSLAVAIKRFLSFLQLFLLSLFLRRQTEEVAG